MSGSFHSHGPSSDLGHNKKAIIDYSSVTDRPPTRFNADPDHSLHFDSCDPKLASKIYQSYTG